MYSDDSKPRLEGSGACVPPPFQVAQDWMKKKKKKKEKRQHAFLSHRMFGDESSVPYMMGDWWISAG